VTATASDRLVDLRRATLGDLRAIDVRAASRDDWADEEWLDPEGFSWACEDFHGHVRAHSAMIGPWVARRSWPSRAAGPEEDG
jgi:hypothetical protein